MNIGKTSLFGITSIVGLGLPTTIGAFYKDHASIWDLVKDKALPDDDSLKSEWELLKTNLSSVSETITDEKLKEIKSSSQESSTNNSLRTWCVSSYLSTYKNWFQSENKNLLKDVETACVLTIKTKLGQSALDITNNSSENDFKTNLSSLKTYKGNNLDDDLKKLQEKIKSINPSSEKHWEELKNWCSEAYKKPYQDPSSNIWKLSEKFCKRATQ